MIKFLRRFLLVFALIAPTHTTTPVPSNHGTTPTQDPTAAAAPTPAPAPAATNSTGQPLLAGQAFMLQKSDQSGWLSINPGANNAGSISQSAAATFQIAGTAGTAVTYARTSSGTNSKYGAFSLQTQNNGNYISITDSTSKSNSVIAGYIRNNVASNPSSWETLFFQPNQVVTSSTVDSLTTTAVKFGDTVYIGRGTGRNGSSIWININGQKEVISYSNEADTGGVYSTANAAAFIIVPAPAVARTITPAPAPAAKAPAPAAAKKGSTPAKKNSAPAPSKNNNQSYHPASTPAQSPTPTPAPVVAPAPMAAPAAPAATPSAAQAVATAAGVAGQAMQAGQAFMLQKADQSGWLTINPGATNAGGFSATQSAAATFQIAGTAGTAVMYARTSSGAAANFGAFSLQTPNNGNYITITDSTSKANVITPGYVRNNVAATPSTWETLFFQPNQAVTNSSVAALATTPVKFGDTVFVGRGTGRNSSSIWIQVNSQSQVISYSNEIDPSGAYSTTNATAFIIVPVPAAAATATAGTPAATAATTTPAATTATGSTATTAGAPGTPATVSVTQGNWTPGQGGHGSWNRGQGGANAAPQTLSFGGGFTLKTIDGFAWFGINSGQKSAGATLAVGAGAAPVFQLMSTKGDTSGGVATYGTTGCIQLPSNGSWVTLTSAAKAPGRIGNDPGALRPSALLYFISVNGKVGDQMKDGDQVYLARANVNGSTIDYLQITGPNQVVTTNALAQATPLILNVASAQALAAAATATGLSGATPAVPNADGFMNIPLSSGQTATRIAVYANAATKASSWTVFALTTSGSLMQCTITPAATTAWAAYPTTGLPTPATLTDVSVGVDGTLWSLGTGGTIFAWSASTNAWVAVPAPTTPAGGFTRISVGDANTIWGVNSAGNIFQASGTAAPATATWKPMPGAAASVSTGPAGGQAFAQGSADSKTYIWSSSVNNWIANGSGWAGKVIFATASGKCLMTGPDQNLYQANSDSSFAQSGAPLTPLTTLKQCFNVTAAADGSIVTLDGSGSVWAKGMPVTIAPPPIQIGMAAAPAQVGISAAAPVGMATAPVVVPVAPVVAPAAATTLLVPNADGFVTLGQTANRIAVYTNGSAWTLYAITSGGVLMSRTVTAASSGSWAPFSTQGITPGTFSDVSVGTDGTLWCIGANQGIYAWNASANSWYQTSGGLTRISVGDNNTVWGVNGGGSIYQATLASNGNSLTASSASGLAWSGIAPVASGVTTTLVSTGPAGSQIYAQGSNKTIYRYTPTASTPWTATNGASNAIATPTSGRCFVAGTDYNLYQVNADLTNYSSLNTMKGQYYNVAIAADGSMLVIDSSSNVWSKGIPLTGAPAVVASVQPTPVAPVVAAPTPPPAPAPTPVVAPATPAPAPVAATGLLSGPFQLVLASNTAQALVAGGSTAAASSTANPLTANWSAGPYYEPTPASPRFTLTITGLNFTGNLYLIPQTAGKVPGSPVSYGDSFQIATSGTATPSYVQASPGQPATLTTTAANATTFIAASPGIVPAAPVAASTPAAAPAPAAAVTANADGFMNLGQTATRIASYYNAPASAWTVYAVTSAGALMQRTVTASTPGTWATFSTNPPGTITDVSVGVDGTLWCIGAGQAIYAWNSTGNAWVTVPGGLARIAVGDAGTVFGVNGGGAIYQATTASTPANPGWLNIPGGVGTAGPGALGAISVAPAGTATYLLPANSISCRFDKTQPASNPWTNNTTRFTTSAISSLSPSGNCFAIGSVDSNIYQLNPGTMTFGSALTTLGSYSAIAVAADGSMVVLDKSGNVLSKGIPVPGASSVTLPTLAAAAAVPTGKVAPTFTDGSLIWTSLGAPTTPTRIALYANAASSASSWTIYALCGGGLMSRTVTASSQGSWTKFPLTGLTASAAVTDISVGVDGTLWCLNGSDGQTIYAWNAPSSTWVMDASGGRLSRIAVGDANTVWGTNVGSSIYRSTTPLITASGSLSAGWTQVPGGASGISTGPAKTMTYVVGGGNVIYWQPNNLSSNWSAVSGLNVTAVAAAPNNGALATGTDYNLYQLNNSGSACTIKELSSNGKNYSNVAVAADGSMIIVDKPGTQIWSIGIPVTALPQ